jgi:uncharacterized damage-inducible protein DinB
MTPNPYAADLGNREPLDALADTPGRIREMVQHWSVAQFERTYAEGRWTARQVLIHLAQTELALTTRARFALSQPGYAAQAFSQDDWMPIDARTSAQVALDAYTSLRQMNMEMWRSLSDDERNRAFSHPEYGELTVWWIASQLAGHDIHHFKQLAQVGSG